MKRLIFPRSAAVLLVGLALCSPLLNGCGGSGHGGALSTTASGPASAHAAQATVTIKWPAQPIVTGIAPRLIPLASNSVTVTITQGSHTVAAHLFTRPGADQPLTSTYTFGNTDALPVGSLTATAKAFPSVDGKGTAQSSGSYDFVTTLGSNAPIKINMGTTIVNLAVKPFTPTVAVGVTTQMTATAFDSAGDMVLTTASKLQWSSSAPAIASVDPNTGVVTSVALGNALLTATDGESGQNGSTNILVTDSGGSGGGGGTATYTITDLGIGISASGINNLGQVVGESGGHGFLYSNGNMQDIGTLPGYTYSIPNGINDAGQIVGKAIDGSGTVSSAFLYSNGQLQDLGKLPGGVSFSEALGINNTGQVVGNSDIASGSHAFLYSKGHMQDLGTLSGGGFSFANGINNAGQVVGSATLGNYYHAFLYSSGQLQDLGTLASSDSEANAINTKGQIVGQWNGHGFLYNNGQMQDLGTLSGYSYSTAYSINSSGQIVGACGHSISINGLSLHPFLYSSDQIQDLNALIPAASGWQLIDARGINDNGQICGNGTINGVYHAFLLTPVGLTPQRRH